MAKNDKIKNSQEVNNTGISATSTTGKTARFIMKDGTANVHFKGVGFLQRFSIYNWMINMNALKFTLFVLSFYTSLNFFFAALYYFFCMDHLSGVIANTPYEAFEEAFFFSSQTLTTVGYGRVSPVGLGANIIASLEALVGIMSLAIMTGLLYGRFVKPKAYLAFSNNAVIAPFKDGKALMFRIIPIKGARLSDVKVTVNCGLQLMEDGKMANKFFELQLQISRISTLFTSWTLVHPIDENSPLANLSFKDLVDGDFEMFVFITAHDEDFSSTVLKRGSYTFEEVINGAKFDIMHHDDLEGRGTIVNFKMLNSHQLIPEAAI